MENDNERRTIVAIGLSLLIYMLWISVFAPPVVPPAETINTVADVPATAVEQTSTPQTVVSKLPVEEQVTPESPPEKQIAPIVVPDRRVEMSSESWMGSLLSKEGAITHVSLEDVKAQPKVTPIWSHLLDRFSGEAEEWSAYSGGEEPQPVLSERGALVLAGTGTFRSDVGYRLNEKNEEWVAEGRTQSGLHITKTYRQTGNPNTIDIIVRFENRTGAPLSDLWVGVADEMSGTAGRFENTTRPFAFVNDDIERLEDLEDVEKTGPIVHDQAAEWFGVGDKYFMGILLPDDSQVGKVSFGAIGDGRYGAFWVDGQTLDAGATREHRYTAFIGPKNLDLLTPLGRNLDKSVEFGWFGFFAKALLWLLKMFQGLVVNWGVAIILLTVLVKIVFFPLMQKQFVSSKRMQILQPELKELKERYKDNRELQTQMTMKLFREHEVNPMGGCLPMLIQMPVWFALYNVMLFSVEIYNTSFLYLDDLTQIDPYGFLPLLVSVLMFFQQKMMPMGNMDPMQQKMMRLMPVMFGVFMFTFPSGLVLYFSVNNTLTILQQWFIYRDKDKSPVTATT